MDKRPSRKQPVRQSGWSDCQTLAALGAACIDHSAAAASRHAGTETVGTLASHDGGLVSTFHVGLAKSAKRKWKVRANATMRYVLSFQGTACILAGGKRRTLN